MSLCFVDTETTGLDPERHEVWDIALIEENGTEHEFHVMPKHLDRAEPDALRITRFYDRITAPDFWDSEVTVAYEVARLTAGKHLVGAVPSFDAAFLAHLLRRNQMTAAWHYHLVDVENMVAGRLRIPPPWDSDHLTREIGVAAPIERRHTALGDAQWAKAMYEAVMKGDPE